MKQKSQETISQLNPHAIYLNVKSPRFNLTYLEKEITCRLDKWGRRVSLNSISDYPSLCFTYGPLHFSAA